MEIKAPRGTNDILPPVSLQWQYVEKKAKEVISAYNYQEIRTPIFEYTELFQRGIGEVTDIVEKEMYTFEDKSGRSITLRPEGTASIVRSFVENKIYGRAQPTKYYYIGPMFRYERPQAGRFRQFHQLGVETFGSNDPAIDAEVIKLGLDILETLHLEDIEVYINSIGCPQCRARYTDILKDYFYKFQDDLCAACNDRIEKNPLRVLDCKEEKCAEIIKNAPLIDEHLCESCEKHFQGVKEYLLLLDVSYKIDPTLVRGLDYYTNTAFEIKYKGLGAQDTIFGGGRYNGLVEEIGQKSVPGIGFAIGLERLILTMEEQNISIPVDEGLDLFITTIGEKARKKAFQLVHKLRKSGFKTDIDYLDRSVGSQMKHADRMNANFSIILGENELESNQASIKNMKTGDQIEINLDNLIDKMRELL